MTYIVPWEGRWTFIQEINGIFATPPPINTTRLPMQCEDAPNLLVASTGEAKGFGVGNTIPNFRPGISPYVFNYRPYKYAKVPVLFQTPDYKTTGDETLLEIERDLNGDIISLPFGFYKLDDVPGTQGIGKYVPNTAYSITRYRVTDFDDDLLDDLRGKVNISPLFGKEPGTVLFLGAQTRSSKDFGGVVLNTVRYMFSWKKDKWNQGISPLTGDMVDYDPPIYEEAEHNDLFS